MLTLLFCCLIFGGCFAQSTLRVRTTAKGAYSILVNEDVWLSSGTTGARNHGEWANLNLVDTNVSTGIDGFGSFTEIHFIYQDHSNTAMIFDTSFRSYDSNDLIVFTQYFPNGCNIFNFFVIFFVVPLFPKITKKSKNVFFFDFLHCENMQEKKPITKFRN